MAKRAPYRGGSSSVQAVILHGFTGTLDTVRILGSVCDERNIPYRMPLLRGHGTRPEDLEGVTWHDWFEDAEEALLDATAHGGQAVVMGLSMGGLVALDLAAQHPDRVCGLVAVSACLELASPLLVLLPVIQRLYPYWEAAPPTKPRITDNKPTAYSRFPTRALASLVEYTHVVRPRIGNVRAPLLVVQSWSDKTVKPRSARVIYDLVESRDKELARFDGAEHDLLVSMECDSVARRIGDWLDLRLADWRASTRKPTAAAS